MVQIVEQTKEEKIAMYMKCTKRELIEMLINCNDIISKLTPQIASQDYLCNHEWDYSGTVSRCKKCGAYHNEYREWIVYSSNTTPSITANQQSWHTR